MIWIPSPEKNMYYMENNYMKINKYFLIAVLLLFFTVGIKAASVYKPWDNGKLVVSSEQRYLKFENGKPFFWLGETGWLMPERLNRNEVSYYLMKCREAGYNVVQVQTVNDVPAYNVYGQSSFPFGYNFKKINRPGVYGYWDHMDYIVKSAQKNGIYIGMVCIWGGLVKSGLMDVAGAKAYGKFLAERYKDYPNIIWMIGGDIKGSDKTEVWETLAKTIKKYDKNHLMTFHPRGRYTSAEWFNNAEWLDFNMFQSGHRRYGQDNGDKDYPIEKNTEEDNWRFVKSCLSRTPLKPVLDDEPIYEDIPQGLHDPAQPHWDDADVRRYAYWSVFAGSFGHSYGNNNIMQFIKPGVIGSFGADGMRKTWYEAIEDDPGFSQMKYLKNLMLSFPYFERVPDQKIVSGDEGYRYDRLIATRGNDYILVYDYSCRPMTIDLGRISGKKKNVWWYNPRNGRLKYEGCYESGKRMFRYDGGYMRGCDMVLIAIDSEKSYLSKDLENIPDEN